MLVGFAGVLVILRPGIASIEPAAFLAIVSALAYSLAQLLGRRLGVTESASVMTFYMAIMFIYLGGACSDWRLGPASFPTAPIRRSDFLFRAWTAPTRLELSMLAAIGIISAVGFVFLTQAYRIGEANKVAPFEYTVMIWAVILSYLFLRQHTGHVYASRRRADRRKRDCTSCTANGANKQSELKGRGPFQSRYGVK